MSFDALKSLRRGVLFRLLLGSGLFLSSVSPAFADTESPLVLTPAVGVENGGLALGGSLRYFVMPNLAGEIDAGYGTSLCQNCHLSATTLTANLVYEIHPASRLFLSVAAGGGFIDSPSKKDRSDSRCHCAESGGNPCRLPPDLT